MADEITLTREQVEMWLSDLLDGDMLDMGYHKQLALCRLALKSFDAPPVPSQDWVMVPKEPTDEMHEAAADPFHAEWKKQREYSEKQFGKLAFASEPFSREIYRAMIHAAQGKADT